MRSCADTKLDYYRLLIRARKELTDQPGWQDTESTVELIEDIDNEIGDPLPEAAKGAYWR